MPTNYEIRGLVISQNGANIHSAVPTSLQYPATNLYRSVVDFIYFRCLVEEALFSYLHGRIESQYSRGHGCNPASYEKKHIQITIFVQISSL